MAFKLRTFCNSAKNTDSFRKNVSFQVQNLVLVLYFSLFVHVNVVNGENILFFVGGISSHSHRAGLEPLANRLADLGHNVTFLSPAKSVVPHPNITEFCPSELREFYKSFLFEFGVNGLKSRLSTKDSAILKGTLFFDSSYAMWEIIFKSREFNEWMNKSLSSGPGFDLFVIDNCGNEAAYALAHKFKAKTMSYVSISHLLSWDYDFLGIPSEGSWLPAFVNGGIPGEMTVVEKILNLLSTLGWYFDFTSYHLPRLDKLSREALDMPDMPPLDQLIKEERIILVNHHYSDYFAKSVPPFVVPVGGMHLKESKGNLTTELEKFIDDGASDGFMYISFGSIVSISTIPPETLQVFFDALKDSKMKFLWKWEGEAPKNSPKNVLFQKWFPQLDVLAHPKIRGFISQGGQVSIQQAIFNGVPIICLPVNGDQDFNCRRASKIGNGIPLEFSELTVETIRDAITRLTEDITFENVAHKLSKMSRDRPMNPVDTAAWWTEYVLRTGDMSLLKPLSINKSWLHTRLLDVWAIIFSLLSYFVFISALALYYSVKFVFKKLSQKPKHNIKIVVETVKDKEL